jgi:8-oxo-dGTP pyrophosphatase MutT (NUDIX family)
VTSRFDGLAVDVPGVVIHAAGGVVWRRGAAGRLEVVLVHRPSYDDWSFPKGKRDAGERDEDTALREVEEETGLSCRLGPELASTTYLDAKSRQKLVRYWAMTVEDERPRPPDHEVDEVRWLPKKDAKRLLTYERDRKVLRSLRDVLDRG